MHRGADCKNNEGSSGSGRKTSQQGDGTLHINSADRYPRDEGRHRSRGNKFWEPTPPTPTNTYYRRRPKSFIQRRRLVDTRHLRRGRHRRDCSRLAINASSIDITAAQSPQCLTEDLSGQVSGNGHKPRKGAADREEQLASDTSSRSSTAHQVRGRGNQYRRHQPRLRPWQPNDERR